MSKDAQTATSRDRIAELKALTVAELRDFAAELQIDSTSGLRKDELINSILKAQKRQAKDKQETSPDWLEVNEAGPHWLEVKWQVSEKLLRRAIASLGKDWHSARKILRTYKVSWDDSGPHAREHAKDYLLPNNAKNWFVNIDEGDSGWKLELGFLAPGGKFFSLLHSADIQVNTSQQQQLSPLQTPKAKFNLNSNALNKEDIKLSIEGDISFQGTTTPGANTVVDDDQVKIHEKTGNFSWNTPLQNGRVVIPVVTEIGNQRLRAIISIESNIHYLEPEKTGIDS